jgi:hypothetical protein
MPGPRGGALTLSLEVYDWDARTWRAVRAGGQAAALTPGEVAGGVVRARVTSDGGQVAVSLSDAP